MASARRVLLRELNTNFEAFFDDNHAVTEWVLYNRLLRPLYVSIGLQFCSDIKNSTMDIVLDVGTAILKILFSLKRGICYMVLG